MPKATPPSARQQFSVSITILAAITCFMTGPAWADPPPWAPAHGYRAKHRHYDDEGERYPATGYIVNGSCNRAALGTVLGGVVGGAVGAQVGKGSGRDTATVIGAIVGAVVGGSIGRSMDETDRYCTGQTLEYAQDRHPVAWRNPDTGGSYVVTPTRTYQRGERYCREYTTKATVAGRTQQVYGTACRQDDGSWQIVTR